MLEIEFDLPRISATQAFYRERGTVKATETARQIMGMRTLLEKSAERFRDWQREAANKGNALLKDGRELTIVRDVLDPVSSTRWPVVRAPILHGAQFPGTRLFPGAACPSPTNDWISCNEAYVTTLYDAANATRQFRDLAALAIYLAPLNRLRIVWIGREVDAPSMMTRLARETANWTDLRPVSRDYHDVLTQKCLNYVK